MYAGQGRDPIQPGLAFNSVSHSCPQKASACLRKAPSRK